eukprot:7678629-Pyramimonas_sp.AAC.1
MFLSTPDGMRRGWFLSSAAMRASRPRHSRSGTCSTPQGVRIGWGRYACQGPKAWQAWHTLHTAAGAQGVGSLCVQGFQGVAIATHSPHRNGCAGGGVAMRAR